MPSSALTRLYAWQSLATTVAGFTLYWLALAVHRLYGSPLKAIPGPPLAAVSPAWMSLQAVHKRLCYAIDDLFEKYGPVVRVSPTMVMFRDAETTRDVYGIARKLGKGDLYKMFRMDGRDTAFTTVGHMAHSFQRKAFSAHYTSTNLALFTPEIHDKTHDLVVTLENIGGKEEVKCLSFFRHITVDVTVASLFGYNLGATSRVGRGERDEVSCAVHDYLKCAFIKNVMPRWMFQIARKYPNQRWQDLCLADGTLADFVIARVIEAKAQYRKAGELGALERPTVLHRMLAYQLETSNVIDEHAIVSEMMSHLIAGTDTTSTTLSYSLWELSRHPDMMNRLRQEFETAFGDCSTTQAFPSFSALQQLPYFNAFLTEVLRLYTAVPSRLERVAPSGEPLNLMGYSIPAGTVIATQGFSMHRAANIFPDPWTFNPDRWLEFGPESDEMQRMQMWMMPFGHGPRVCVGQNLAQMILRTVICAIVRRFDVVAAEGVDEESMKMRDHFVMLPAGDECKLIFVPRS